ncbi:MAG TPA: hypothetical protein PKG48_10945 [Bacteroidales bacterium]|nr:hypothetical protein [Bacteroidales bacterium]
MPTDSPSPYVRFLKKLLLFTAILGAIALVIKYFATGIRLTPALPFLFCFFIATTLLSYYYLERATRQRFARFVNIFLLSILLKLLVYAGVLAAYAFLNREDTVPFIFAFFILYICYTVFESAGILVLTRRNDPPAGQ